MKRDCLIITSLPCEATPLIKQWQLKPLRRNRTEERFQLSHNNGIYVAVSGIGKVRSAVATSALLASGACSQPNPLVINVGIAGSSIEKVLPGTLVYINKIRDFASKSQFFPDVIVKHRLEEAPLETHDAPVTTPLDYETIVDMEASGFIQGALTFSSPSTVLLLKVISDMCDGTSITPRYASQLIEAHTDTIWHLLETTRTLLPEPIPLNDEEQRILQSVISHAQLSSSQQHELSRCLTALKAQEAKFIAPLQEILQTPINSKTSRNTHYTKLLETLYKETLA